MIRANGTANLFLINPGGIVFGQNASLNVGGSFVATTADAIEFDNLGVFSTTNQTNNPTILTVNPSAILSNQITGISVQNTSGDPSLNTNSFSSLVPSGELLLIDNDSVIRDSGGRFTLASLFAPQLSFFLILLPPPPPPLPENKFIPDFGFIDPLIVLTSTADLMDTSCTAFDDTKGSGFIVTGRGGLPPSPDEPLTNDIIWTDTRIPTITAPQPETAVKPSPKNNAVSVIPATGWVFNGKGEVTLIWSIKHR